MSRVNSKPAFPFASAHWLKESTINPRTGVRWENGDALVCSCGQRVVVGKGGFAGLKHHQSGLRHFNQLQERIEAAASAKVDPPKLATVSDAVPVSTRHKVKATSASRARISMGSSDDKFKDAESRAMSSLEKLSAFRTSKKSTTTAAPSGSKRKVTEDEEDHLQTLRMRQLLKDAKKSRLSTSSPLDSKITRKDNYLTTLSRFNLSPSVVSKFKLSRKRDARLTL